MPDMGLGSADLGTAELLSSADLPPLPGYGPPGQLQGDLLDPLSEAGRSPGLKYEALVGSPGDFLSLDMPKGGGLGAFGGVPACLPWPVVACASWPPGRLPHERRWWCKVTWDGSTTTHHSWQPWVAPWDTPCLAALAQGWGCA